MSDIGERVKKIVVEHLGVEPDKVTENASFIDDLGADSLDTVELVMAFEEEFGCEIPDDAAETILTVGDAIKFLEKNAKKLIPRTTFRCSLDRAFRRDVSATFWRDTRGDDRSDRDGISKTVGRECRS